MLNLANRLPNVVDLQSAIIIRAQLLRVRKNSQYFWSIDNANDYLS